jgi:asparagine synthase (glutamine-hydrolysing)
VVDEQLSCLRHRGPDAQGRFEGSGGTVAQNRLATIDLVAGDPPITHEDDSVAAVLNGEMYNFRELRSELMAQGHGFSSSGDTELLAHLAQEMSALHLAQRLAGMFAFATWGERRHRLLLGIGCNPAPQAGLQPMTACRKATPLGQRRPADACV